MSDIQKTFEGLERKPLIYIKVIKTHVIKR